MLQLSMFERSKAESVEEPTRVILRHRAAYVPLKKRRRQAHEKLLELLAQLEGKDIYVGYCGGSRSHFWVNNLKLSRLELEKSDGTIVLWGAKGASVRIFTERLVNVREQEYQGYTLWLVDFWNGFGEYPIDPYRPVGYTSLDIVRFKD